MRYLNALVNGWISRVTSLLPSRFGSPLKSRPMTGDELFLDEGDRPPPRTAGAGKGRRMGGWADERAKTAKSVSPPMPDVVRVDRSTLIAPYSF